MADWPALSKINATFYRIEIRKEPFMKKTPKQIAAIICIILLVLLYAATLAVSLMDFPGSDRLFAACLLATVGLPILLWIYIWLYGKFTGRPTIADASSQKRDSQKER